MSGYSIFHKIFLFFLIPRDVHARVLFEFPPSFSPVSSESLPPLFIVCRSNPSTLWGQWACAAGLNVIVRVKEGDWLVFCFLFLYFFFLFPFILFSSSSRFGILERIRWRASDSVSSCRIDFHPPPSFLVVKSTIMELSLILLLVGVRKEEEEEEEDDSLTWLVIKRNRNPTASPAAE